MSAAGACTDNSTTTLLERCVPPCRQRGLKAHCTGMTHPFSYLLYSQATWSVHAANLWTSLPALSTVTEPAYTTLVVKVHANSSITSHTRMFNIRGKWHVRTSWLCRVQPGQLALSVYRAHTQDKYLRKTLLLLARKGRGTK